jgi:hypothetical protein
MSTDEKTERLFERARAIVIEAEAEERRCKDLPTETIQKLAFRIAVLEHADRNEYGEDD